MSANAINIELAERGITQIDLAEKLHVNHCYLNRVINGHRKSDVLKARISKKLDIPINELWPDMGRAPRAKASP